MYLEEVIPTKPYQKLLWKICFWKRC